MNKPARWSLLSALLLLCAACSSVEEKRIRELLNEKGFGTRAQGVAQIENYVAGGDLIQFLLDQTVLLAPGAEQLGLLAAPQPVGIDGTILIPYAGPVMVLGLTERELSALVQEQLQAYFQFEIRVQARILSYGKVYFAYGEVGMKGRIPMLLPDLTIFEAISMLQPTALANLGRVRVIKPDAENPLIIHVNFREMIETGDMTYNVPLHNNDIVFIPPTFFGTLSRFVEKLLSPLNVIVGALFGAANLRASYEYVTADQVYGSPYYRF